MKDVVGAIKERWKLVAGAAVSVALVFGVTLPEGVVDTSTELVAQVAAGALGLFALGRVVWDRIQARLNRPG